MVFAAAQKPDPVGQNSQGAFAVHQPADLHAMFQDRKDQFLFRRLIGVGDAFVFGQLHQRAGFHLLQLRQVQLRPVITGGNADAFADLGGLRNDLFGQGQRAALGIEFADASVNDFVWVSRLLRPAVVGMIT